jgi:hypothetical protein
MGGVAAFSPPAVFPMGSSCAADPAGVSAGADREAEAFAVALGGAV